MPKYALFFIILPILFILWVAYTSYQSIKVRNKLEEGVTAISTLSYIDNLITEGYQTANFTLNSSQVEELLIDLELVQDVIPEYLYQDTRSWVNSQGVNDLELQKSIKSFVNKTRLGLSDISNRLNELWDYAIYTGILSCLFAILSAFLFYRALKTSQKLETANVDLATNRQELESSNKTKDKLFAIIAHDLRNPVGTLKGYFDLIENGSIGQDSFEKFGLQLKQEVDKVHFTLNNLLFWAKEQLEGLKTNPVEFEISHLVHENINLIKNAANEKKITLSSTIKNETVFADKEQIRLVLRNILSNAVKYSKADGKIEVSSIKNENYLTIHVADNGTGIDSETLDKLFKDEPVKSQYGTVGEKGTGLGLLLCKEFCEMNGGEIKVESELGKGSTFKFSIPLIGRAT